ncbi:MAG: MFS transporter [Pseudomonadales bacterium]|nr:MFS transporter [Pseudomonadales bacterium]
MSFSPQEKQATGALAGIYSLRMLGLFMLLPVFSLYAGDEYKQVTPFLIGLAVGVYGLTQALFQIPYGLLSDRVGRKPLIYFGLALFAMGGVVAALSESIYGVIAGRALQGSGAIAAVTTALLSDLTQEENRTKAMAVIGMSIGLSFMLAMMVAPSLVGWVGLGGLFWITAILAVGGMWVSYSFVPTPQSFNRNKEALPVLGQLRGVFFSKALIPLNLSIFLLHFILTACFVVLPLILNQYSGLESSEHGHIYLLTIGLSFLAMLPLMIFAEKMARIKEVFLLAVVIMFIGLLLLALYHRDLDSIVLALFLFFFSFNLLEALLPSLVSRVAPAGQKGSAMGVYSSGQFLGAFLGGILGGGLSGSLGYSSVFIALLLLVLVWFYVIWTMDAPILLQGKVLRLWPEGGAPKPQRGSALLEDLLGIDGVEEAVVLEDEGVAYLKVDKRTLDVAQLEKLSLVNPQQNK